MKGFAAYKKQEKKRKHLSSLFSLSPKGRRALTEKSLELHLASKAITNRESTRIYSKLSTSYRKGERSFS